MSWKEKIKLLGFVFCVCLSLQRRWAGVHSWYQRRIVQQDSLSCHARVLRSVVLCSVPYPCVPLALSPMDCVLLLFMRNQNQRLLVFVLSAAWEP